MRYWNGISNDPEICNVRQGKQLNDDAICRLVVRGKGEIRQEGHGMNHIIEMLKDTPLPKMARITQDFPANKLADPVDALRAALESCPASMRLRPGMRIAVTVGSRGIAELKLLVSTLISWLKEKDVAPFIVPAMGSHGGATAEGQVAVLASFDITEESMGCPILSSMETELLGTLTNGMQVRMDKNAMAADGILIFNRIKPHNSFRYRVESGLVKMLAIGLGKQSGADQCHSWGFEHLGEIMTDMARMKLERCKIFMGVATVENAYDQLARIIAVTPEELIEREAEELRYAKDSMPRLMLDPLDVLVVDQSGKEFSGGGMDANITGMSAGGWRMSDIIIKRIVALRLSPHSLGNAIGMGLADVTTQQFYEAVDFKATYTNVLTSKLIAAARLPMVMPSDYNAIQAAIKSSTPKDMAKVRVVRIPNTLHLHEAYISEGLLPDAEKQSGIRILSEPAPMTFDEHGTLLDPWGFA